MTAEQIAEMVLDLYAARPEAKEYLDFFVSPDIDKKLDKARSAIKKEISRTSRGRNRARSTKVRRLIKDVASLNPGAEYVAEIMTFALETMCETSKTQIIKTTTQNGFARLLHETLLFIDSNGALSQFLPRIETAVNAMVSHHWRNGEFKSLLQSEIIQTIETFRP